MIAVNESITELKSTRSEQLSPNRSWFESLVERIQDLDTEFPLSGGEDGHTHTVRHKAHARIALPAEQSKPSTIASAEPTTNPSFIHWFNGLVSKIQDLECDFPLSGGEHVSH